MRPDAILITYATMTGNSQIAAIFLYGELSKNFLEKKFIIKNIRDVSINELLSYKKVILGISTWEYDLNPDSEDFVELLKKERPSLSPIYFGLFGMGDSWFEKFCAAVPIVQKKLETNGARIYGEIFKIDGYPDRQALLDLLAWAKKFVLD